MTDTLNMPPLKGQYAVFGNPIAQSKSPLIHNEFARTLGYSIDYKKILVELEGFEGAAKAFFNTGGRGLNITAPFKEDAYHYADQLTPRAKSSLAVNTLCLQDDGSVLGDNTDGAGMMWDIATSKGWSVKGKRVLILGAGGATRGVLYSLLQLEPALLCIANRSTDKAIALADKYGSNVIGSSFDDIDTTQKFDVIINGTSAGLHGSLPNISESLFHAECHVYDMSYANEPTKFLQWAIKNKVVNYSDGLGMLIGQAAESFTIWHGLKPNTQAVMDKFRTK